MAILDVPELLPWMQKAMTTFGPEGRRRCAMTSVNMKKRLVGVKFALQVLLFADESVRRRFAQIWVTKRSKTIRPSDRYALAEYEELAELTEPTELYTMKINIGGAICFVYLPSRVDSSGGSGFDIAGAQSG
ncbi:hypothetical protein M436DRAFT_64289 [Aureobasidium namibiae CBS 147.97]|uniref:Uncharacterized protein n=1 Tax=Aureobasidium namibiae CBS 147.97 TaxID=1043004 RepID=A0A074WTU4_9PEZI|nr:uncharacterized protein M436DRAFT_64289 [Aureobasidium namibiae CBS 147.97]KEQ73137.1 hypothetical protein M436DRAFT_64289 [Aureobasidium namibiae CBS 147.97]